MRPAGRWMTWLLVACVVMATASCGSRGTATVAPSGTAAPARASSPAGHAVPTRARAAHARRRASAAVIVGVVEVNAGCPVDPVYHVCRPRPLGHVEVRALSGSAVLASVRTQADGRYILRLRPGSYVLVVQTMRAFPRCPRMPVSVGSGTLRRANITCDAGIASSTQSPPNST